MSRSDRPSSANPAAPAKTAREERLRAALRANLQRRKAQARAKGAETPAPAAKPDKAE